MSSQGVASPPLSNGYGRELNELRLHRDQGTKGQCLVYGVLWEQGERTQRPLEPLGTSRRSWTRTRGKRVPVPPSRRATSLHGVPRESPVTTTRENTPSLWARVLSGHDNQSESTITMDFTTVVPSWTGAITCPSRSCRLLRPSCCGTDHLQHLRAHPPSSVLSGWLAALKHYWHIHGHDDVPDLWDIHDCLRFLNNGSAHP